MELESFLVLEREAMQQVIQTLEVPFYHSMRLILSIMHSILIAYFQMQCHRMNR